MKKLIVLSAYIILFASYTYSQGFNSVFSKDGMFVIAVGDAGNVFMSYDGGVTFGSYPLPGLNLNSVYAINQMVWLVGDAGGFRGRAHGGGGFYYISIWGEGVDF